MEGSMARLAEMRLFNINTPNPCLPCASLRRNSADTQVRLLFPYYLLSVDLGKEVINFHFHLPMHLLKHPLIHGRLCRDISGPVSSHAREFSLSQLCAPSRLPRPHIRFCFRLQTAVVGQKAGAISILKMHHIGQRVWATTLQEHYADRSPCWLSVSHFSGSVHP